MAEAEIKWFTEAKLNIAKNCIDRHLNKEVINSIIFEPNDPSEEALHISYNELHQRVCKMANVLREQGIKEIEFVFIYQ
jgi:acetyl-CoA synthetase